MARPEYLCEFLIEGSYRARPIAQAVLEEVEHKMGSQTPVFIREFA